ncbi:MAG TPA: hypothetical protein VEC18_09165 [Myxococcota bacterium]|nr:hypothetical protein [Myxococcota bacterium]
MSHTRSIALLIVALAALSARAHASEIVELIPATRPPWTLGRLFAPIAAPFRGGPDFWYGDRSLEIETEPASASLDLFYLRDGVQLRFERATAPVVLRLPRRIDAGPRDAIEIRAILEGHREQQLRVDVRSPTAKAAIALAPLPNRLEDLLHAHLSGRESLRFITTQKPRFRIRRTPDGFSVALSSTFASARALERMRSVASASVESLRADQLGEDLVLWVRLDPSAAPGVELRSLEGYDAVREQHRFSVELVPAEGNAVVLERCRAALDRIPVESVSGCALEFDRALRAQLDPEALASALAPASGFLDPYLRAALERLGELSAGRFVELTDTTRFQLSTPIGLEAASARAAEVVGYLSLWRALVTEMEPPQRDPRNALRGVVAPDLPSERFDAAVEFAERSEQRCYERAGS